MEFSASFVVALLQVRAEGQSQFQDSAAENGIELQRHSLLIIEEPELYQHPTLPCVFQKC